MRFLRRTASRFLGVFRAGEIDREILQELESHIQLHIDEGVRLGMTEDDARAEALRCLGDATVARLLYREQAVIPLLFRRVQDFLYSLSSLKKSAVFTAILISTLSLGIGAASAIFGVIHNVLISPYTYVQPQGMYHLLVSGANRNLVWPLYTQHQLNEIRSSSVVESAIGYRNRRFQYEIRHAEIAATGTEVTSNAFRYLGVPVLYGRALDDSDVSSEQVSHPVVVLGYTLWKSAFHGDPQVVGRTFKLNNQPFTIVGVAASRFTWGDGVLFTPVNLADDPSQGYEINLRLRPGVSEDQAKAVLGATLNKFAQHNPHQFPSGFRLELTHLNVPFAPHSRSILEILSLASFALGIVVFVNVSLLAASRLASRHDEFRQAETAHAGTGRLFSYLLTESALLSFAGSLGGLLIALPLTPLLQSSLPAYAFPSEAPTHLGPLGCAVCALFAVGCFLLLGALSAHTCFRQRENTKTHNAPVRILAIRSFVIFGQVMLIALLLFASYATMQAYYRVTHQPLGYQPKGVEIGSLPLHEAKYPSWQQKTAFLEEVLTTLQGTSGQTEVALSTYATPPDGGLKTFATLLGTRAQSQYPVDSHFVSSSYFSLLRVPLLVGVVWTTDEEKAGAPVVVINEAMRRELFGEKQAVGQSIRVPRYSYLQYSLSGPSDGSPLRIIGVVSDFRSDSLDQPIVPAIYLPFSMLLDRNTQLLIRTSPTEQDALSRLQARLHSLAPELPTNAPFQALDSILHNNPGRVRARLLAFSSGAFALCAFAIACFGVYGTINLFKNETGDPMYALAEC